MQPKQKGYKDSHKFLLSQAVATSPAGQTHKEWESQGGTGLTESGDFGTSIPNKRRELNLKPPHPWGWAEGPSLTEGRTRGSSQEQCGARADPKFAQSQGEEPLP